MDCIFCKLASGEIPTRKLYEDDSIVAFYDTDPKAPVHFLVVPREHIASADELNDANGAVVAHIFTTIPKICRELGLTGGYRIVNNCGDDAGQSVKHLHFHVLGGKQMGWTPD